MQELSRLELDSRRDPQARLPEKHVDLTGWRLVASGRDARVKELIQDFQTYLASALECPTELSDAASSTGPGSISLIVDPTLGTVAESFEIRSQEGGVEVLAPSHAGLRQAVYHLQELLEDRAGPFLPIGTIRRVRRMDPTYLYSYFALYGDPLMEADIDPFPEGYLDKLGRIGVNGVWLQAVLRNMAPSSEFPEFGEGWQTRLARLRELVERADRFGMKLFLYLNEPRAMPAEFFTRYPDIKGTYEPKYPDFFAMCTSVPRVREWISDSLKHIFDEVPGLGGVFSITLSENLTNCYARGQVQFCPRCPKRKGWEVVSEVIQTFRDGVRRSSKSAEVIAWDWGWGKDWVRNGADAVKIIQNLPSDVRVMSISEWHKEVNRGGFATRVGEYSMSVVGPGPRARKHWTAARQRGLSTMAKVQLNCTWEISAVPYIPVPNLVDEHMRNLVAEGLDGLMLSWTVGGFPSPNLQAAKEYYYWPTSDRKDGLLRIAVLRYGKQAASLIQQAWTQFSEAFQEFPYGISIYFIPTQHGPANLLRLTETGYPSGMILFPHDDFKKWIGPYPVEIVQSQFAKMAEAWNQGLTSFRKALDLVPQNRSAQARKDLGIAETCHLHFQSVADQVRFYMLREELNKGRGNKKSLLSEMERLTRNEMEAARKQYRLARQDSTIGFEATNHYYYRPLDLAEKVINCDHVLRALAGLGG